LAKEVLHEVHRGTTLTMGRKVQHYL